MTATDTRLSQSTDQMLRLCYSEGESDRDEKMRQFLKPKHPENHPNRLFVIRNGNKHT